MRLLLALFIAFCANITLPQDTLAQLIENDEEFVEGVQSFRQDEDAWKRNANKKQEATPKQTISPLPRFYADNGKTAIENIVKAEQVFCYEVFPQNPDFDGYSLNGFPIKGFCGVLGNQVKDMIATHFFSSLTNVNFEQAENCQIEPQIMIRFIRGVDATDVLLSSPCHSFAIFYAGNINVYNFSPAAEIIETMVSSFNAKHSDFVSPALLNQLLPIGIIQDEAQRKIVNKSSEPIRKWAEKVETQQAQKAAEEKKNSQGWNKLKARSFGVSQ